MGLKSFTFDRSQTEDFVRFGFEHNARRPGWIPPLRAALRAQLAPEFSFYRRPGNHHHHFLCTAGSRMVGRVSAFVNADLRDGDGTPLGAVGFFEAIEDESVTRELLDAAIAWLSTEHGIRRIWGPLNFDIWRGYRFMTRGFEEEPFLGEPSNHRWYPEHFASYGFTVRQQWATREVRGRQSIADLARTGERAAQKFLGRGYRFVSIDLHELSREIARLHGLISASFAGFLGFTPIGLEEFETLFAVSRHGLDPGLFLFALDEHGRAVGFVGAYPDLAAAVRAMHGGSGPLARLQFRLTPRGSRRVILYIGGVLPGEARERAGLGRVGLHMVARAALDRGAENLVGALVASGSVVAGLFGEHRTAVTREYALFELER